MKASRVFPLVMVVFLALVFGCSSAASKKPPVNWAGNGFLTHLSDLKEQPDDAPFHWIWRSEEDAVTKLRESFHSIAVMPVNLAALGRTDNSGSSTSSPAPEDAQDTGNFFRTKIVESLKSNQKLALQVVDAPDENSFVLEPAILELKPTLATLNAVTSVAGFFIPGAAIVSTAISTGASAAAGNLAKGTCAIALRVKNGGTDEAVFEAADRRDDSSALLVDVKDFTQYGHAREALTRWANNIPWLFDQTIPVDKKNPLALLSMW